MLHRLKAADPPAHLDFEGGFPGNFAEDGGILGLCVLRAVEVDHVEPFGPVGCKPAGGFQRVLRHFMGGAEFPLVQADAGPVLDIDCGKNDHVVSLPKFLRMVSPVSPLFSGWNCAPKTVPFPTSAGISVP